MPCQIEKYLVSFDHENEHHGFYDLHISQQLQDGQTHSERSETLVFEAAKQAYPIPASFDASW
jgi:hypothetical protein